MPGNRVLYLMFISQDNNIKGLWIIKSPKIQDIRTALIRCSSDELRKLETTNA